MVKKLHWNGGIRGGGSPVCGSTGRRKLYAKYKRYITCERCKKIIKGK